MPLTPPAPPAPFDEDKLEQGCFWSRWDPQRRERLRQRVLRHAHIGFVLAIIFAAGSLWLDFLWFASFALFQAVLEGGYAECLRSRKPPRVYRWIVNNMVAARADFYEKF